MRVKRLRRIAGRYYWRPAPAIKKIGFRMVPLGADLIIAIAHADRLNRGCPSAWQGSTASCMAILSGPSPRC